MSSTIDKQTVASTKPVARRPVNPPAGAPSALHKVFRTLWPPVVLGALLTGCWYFISYVVLSADKRFLLVPPHEVITKGFIKDDQYKALFASLWQTTQIAAIGLAVSVLIAFTLAIIMSQSGLFENAIFPYMVVLQAVPILALVPLIQFWFGTDRGSRIIVCIIISVFPILLNTLFGLQSADKGLHDLFSLHKVSRITRLRKLMFPAAVPAIFAGLRIAAGLSVIGAIVGDFFFGAGVTGIGQDIRKFSIRIDGPQLLAAVSLTCALGVTVFLLFGWLQKLMVSRWHDQAVM